MLLTWRVFMLHLLNPEFGGVQRKDFSVEVLVCMCVCSTTTEYYLMFRLMNASLQGLLQFVRFILIRFLFFSAFQFSLRLFSFFSYSPISFDSLCVFVMACLSNFLAPARFISDFTKDQNQDQGFLRPLHVIDCRLSLSLAFFLWESVKCCFICRIKKDLQRLN